ncbi:MAG TPA: glucose-6-phosphate dehydrogenase (NADP(+)) [Acidimicrobiales bacterium]|nr:glucose-6-phosphate dehydrogenase (NADP(+)) [Acidimicrobiales bacterium]
MATTTTPGPTVIVLFGATGDLSHRLVIPALYRLAQQGLMPSDWRIVGNGRGDVSHEDFAGRVQESLEEFGPKPSEGPWDEFRSRLRFAGGGFDSDDPGSLLDVLAEAKEELGGSPQLIHYFAVPPSAFASLTQGIGAHGLAEGSRVVYEKPFGTSKESFESLDTAAHQVFKEEQIYRIDHFLGKEATQDIHVLRFANGLFCNAWDRQHIESVQIDVPETLDVGMRAGFYEQTGAILDMIVTHLFQLAAEVAMEPPATLDAATLAAAREEVIGCFRPLTWDDVVVGQYDGYRSIEGVPSDSRTETFVAARLWIDNDRWQGVPFLLRTGKTMAISQQRVSVIFHEPRTGLGEAPKAGNVVGFELSGDGEILLSLVTKTPGPTLTLGADQVYLPLGKGYEHQTLPAYSRLIHDVMIGDRSLFTRPDGLAHVWEVASALLEDKPEPVIYPRGSWGPEEARALAGDTGWLLEQTDWQ